MSSPALNSPLKSISYPKQLFHKKVTRFPSKSNLYIHRHPSMITQAIKHSSKCQKPANLSQSHSLFMLTLCSSPRISHITNRETKNKKNNLQSTHFLASIISFTFIIFNSFPMINCDAPSSILRSDHEVL